MDQFSSNLFLDFFLPRICISCNSKLSSNDKIICCECFNKIEKADEERIEKEFRRKFLKEEVIAGFCSAFVFYDDSVLQKIIHSLKYDHNYHVGKYLGLRSAEIMSEIIYGWEPDLILPVPLHSLRKAERGFNQSAEIAKGISKALKIPFRSKTLKRNKYTHTQTNFNLEERKENVHDAFSAKKGNIIKGAKVIIVDDVITTGATVTECGNKLLAAGAEKVFAVSVAIAA